MVNVNLKQQLVLLGLRVEDRITGMSGVVASVCFDLYGCVQAIVNRGVDKDGKLHEQHWFDVNRLRVLDETPVMEPPNFDYGTPDLRRHEHGAAEKPAAFKP
jgi:hypothetical protein